MARIGDLYRLIRRPYRVQWSDLGPPRLEPNGVQMARSHHQFGSLVDRITKVFFNMDPAVVEQVLLNYREKYGDGAYAYAKRTLQGWRMGQVKQVGQTVMRLLEVVPLYVDLDTKFELARIVREETLGRIRQVQMQIDVGCSDSLTDTIHRVKEVVEAQCAIELPPGVLENQTWLKREDAAYFQQVVREGERKLLAVQSADLFSRIRFLQRIVRQISIPVKIKIVFQIPTAEITFNILKEANHGMSTEDINPDDRSLLHRWTDLELETRFKSGDVSYPEYVLRNMDQFFSKEEQSELHKIAAMHGLELERVLMEIQIKSRTSEADLQKLLNTLKTLQEKGITADIVSRHETPSGHIEISARSGKKLGCISLPAGVLLLAALYQFGISQIGHQLIQESARLLSSVSQAVFQAR